MSNLVATANEALQRHTTRKLLALEVSQRDAACVTHITILMNNYVNTGFATREDARRIWNVRDSETGIFGRGANVRCPYRE